MAKGRGPQPLTVPIQYLFLRRIGFSGALRRGAMCARGVVQPTAGSDAYVLQIRYRLGEHPRVTVVDPELRPLEDGTPIPHVYQPGTRLCLYLPNAGEWGPQDRIADTIVPWSLEWLYHYEVWRDTGSWEGGGVHPRGRTRRRERKGAS